MPSHTSFRLNRSGMLLALISAAFAGEVGAVAGRVDFATSGATIAGRDGQRRPLAKGAELDSGDTVRTDGEGRAQIRFTDGSYVSLQPNTEFSIKDYNFEGKTDGSERGFFGLAKGAMRAVTGLVGRVNRNKYQISTPTATVGIRGTGGRIEVLLDGSTLIAGTSGIWTLTNPSGTLDVPAGTFGRAPSAPNQPPQQTTQGPNTGPAPLPNDPPKPLEPKGVDVKTDPTCQTNPTGAGCTNSITVNTTPPPAPVPPLVSGNGYAIAIVPGAFNGSTPLSTSGVTATFDSAGRLTDAMLPVSDPSRMTLANGSNMDFGTDGILAWGRWVGDITYVCADCSNKTFGPNEGHHYVIGTPTAVMPTTGGGTYSLAGATSPTVVGGGGAPGTVTGGQLVVAFSTGTYRVDLQNFNVSMPSISRNYTLNGGTTVTDSSSLFSMSPTVSGCGTSCSSNVNGFFAGASAERAGIAYAISESGMQPVIGAAAFKK